MKYYDFTKDPYRNYTVEVHIADIHFGAIDPSAQYAILEEQFLSQINKIDFDILSIDGDLFDKKFMANSSAVMYAIEFVNKCVGLCIEKRATLFLIAGTESHDAGQLQLFYTHEANQMLDIRIVEHPRFEVAQGLKILCIPELYGESEEFYRSFLDQVYDTAFIHGTVVGAVFGATKEDLGSPKYPVFSYDSFENCKGPIICGHVHKAMCLNGYIYYCSNPIRYKFGEEEDKGYNIVLHDRKSHNHLITFMPIESFRYDTIDVKALNTVDPNVIVHHLDNLLANGVHNIRIDFSDINQPTLQKIVEQYYATNRNVVVKRYVDRTSPQVNTTEAIQKQYEDLGFLLDPQMDEYSKFVNFINHNEGDQFITVEKLKEILSHI